MKKILIPLLMISAFIAIYYFLISKKGAEPSSNPAHASNSQLKMKTTHRESLKESRYLISKTSESLTSFPHECDSPLSDLSTMTIEDYSEIISSKRLFSIFLGEKCFYKIKSNQIFNDLILKSQCKILQNQKDEKQGSCLTLMFMLKAYFIADHTVGKNPKQMTSQELAANFVKMFFSLDKLTKDSFLTNLKLVDTLFEMHPHDLDVKEAYLGYLMLGKQITQENSINDKIETFMDDSLGESFKVDRFQILKYAINDQFSGIKSTLDKLNEFYPKEPDLAYYYAAYYWEKGNRDMANSYLDKAINQSENCSYCTPELYQITKRRLSNARDKEKKLFSMSIGLNFENL